MPLLSITITPPTFFLHWMELLRSTGQRPESYGVYHIFWLVATVLTVFVLWTRFRDASDTAFRRILLWCWIVMVVFELYKQLISSCYVASEQLLFSYAWGAFPFQLCSTPLYVLPFVVFLPDGPLRRALMAFSSTFAFFGGLAVLFYPASVFTDVVGMNVQTVVHHFLQLCVGAFIGIHERNRLRWRHFFHGALVFLVFLTIAVILNETVHAYLLRIGSDTHFNMFFVSPYYPGPIDFINEWHRNMPPMLFVVLYALGLTVAASVIFSVLRTLARKSNQRKKDICPKGISYDI